MRQPDLKEVAPEVQDYINRLQGALQMTFEALEGILAGRPVPNVPHCRSAVHSLLEGTEYDIQA
jgi:hypothetical protein